MRTSRIAHEFERPLWDRIADRCVWDGECFVWQGTKTAAGYGHIAIERGQGARHVYVHRAAYEHAHGPIGDGLVIDHVRDRGCRSKACCNAAHLEPVTARVNTLRGDGASALNAKKTHCPKGHPLSGDNLVVRKKPGRECRACHLAGCLVRAKRQQERLRERRAS